MDGDRELAFRIAGLGRAYAGGDVDEKDCPLKVGDEVIEPAPEDDMSGEDPGLTLVLASDLGDVDGSDDEDDSRRQTLFC